MIHILLSMIMLLTPVDRSNEVCPCNILSEEIQGIIDTMYRTITDEMAVGLAAPQIGILKRIILVDLAADDSPTRSSSPQIRAFINPEILAQPKANTILIKAYDRNCNIITEEFDGYTAHIFQCEIDHLNGALN